MRRGGIEGERAATSWRHGNRPCGKLLRYHPGIHYPAL